MAGLTILQPKQAAGFYHLKAALLILIPLLYSVLLILPNFYYPPGTNATKFGYQLRWVYVFCVVGSFWMTNVISFPVAGFMPLLAMPLLGTVTSKSLADVFMSNVNILNFGFLTLVLAIEGSGLQRRLTSRILKHSSGSIRWIYIYIFIVTACTAAWMTSAGATFLMIKVVNEMLEILKEGIEKGTLGDERIVLMKRISSKTVVAGGNIEPTQQENFNQTTEILDNQANTEELLSSPQPAARPSIDPQSKSNENPTVDEGTVANKDNLNLDELKAFEKENDELLNGFGGELLYAIAISANIGGTLWPYGSPMGCELFKLKYAIPFAFPNPNINRINFGWTEASWMAFSFPLIVINAIVALSFLLWVNFLSSASIRQKLGLRKNRLCDAKQDEKTLKEMGEAFSTMHSELPAYTFQEKVTVFLIAALIISCLTRLPVCVTGWSELIITRAAPRPTDDTRVDVGDSVPVLITVLLLFIIPKMGPLFFKGPTGPQDKPQHVGFAEWKKVQSKFPWAILVLIGGSSCIGSFSEKTVAEPIAESIRSTIPSPGPIKVQLIMLCLTVFSSNIISNPGASKIIMNIWIKLIGSYGRPAIHPVLIMPVIVSASLCFIIPASSIPTAIVYRYKEQKTLSAWYFLRIGVPLFLCTLFPTVIYALVWRPASLTFVNV